MDDWEKEQKKREKQVKRKLDQMYEVIRQDARSVLSRCGYGGFFGSKQEVEALSELCVVYFSRGVLAGVSNEQLKKGKYKLELK